MFFCCVYKGWSCCLLLAALPSGPQFYFHQDHFDMHQMLDLYKQITKGIERSHLMLAGLVKPQVWHIHSADVAQHCASSVAWICAASHLYDSVQEWGSCELCSLAAGLALSLETCSMPEFCVDCGFREAITETKGSILSNSLTHCTQSFKEHVRLTTSGIFVQCENSPFLGAWIDASCHIWLASVLPSCLQI